MSYVNINITLSWSKIMALVFQTMAFVLDWRYESDGAVFMFCLPFAVVLITGKQVSDIWKKGNGNGKTEIAAK